MLQHVLPYTLGLVTGCDQGLIEMLGMVQKEVVVRNSVQGLIGMVGVVLEEVVVRSLG